MEQRTNPGYFDLFRSFFIIGISAFGGLAMTAHVRKQIVDKEKWLDEQTFDAGLALCQVIPGAIVMQLAAYIGLKLKGVRGSLAAFIGFGLPSFLVMFILSVIYKHARDISTVETILAGLRVIIVAIVANAAYIFGRKNFSNLNDIVIALVALILFLIKLHPAIVLVIASFLGIILTKKEMQVVTVRNTKKTLRAFLWFLAIVLVSAGILFLISNKYFVLSTVMLRIDLLSFGGGLAAMPIMYHELVDLFGWFDEKTFMDGMILGQITPGSIIIAATFFGYMHYGWFGSVLSTICVFTPSYLIFMGIVPFFDKLRAFPQFNKVLNGILCCFVGLLVAVTYRFTIGIHWNVINILFTALVFVLLIRKVDVIWVILGGVAFSLVIPYLF
jgi:chromate transporter